MVNIDDLISEMKSLYKVEGVHTIRFDLPEYEKFHKNIMAFIYENHFENTPEWETISQNLVYKSTQYMTRSEADIILVQSQKLWDEGCCCGRDTKIKDVAQCHKAVKASATPRLRRP